VNLIIFAQNGPFLLLWQLMGKVHVSAALKGIEEVFSIRI
jgi:hypothetical protein